MPNARMGAISLRNVRLVARREYIERVRTRGFLVTTILIPLIMGGIVFGAAFAGSKSNPDLRIAVVSPDVQLALDLQTELERRQQQAGAAQQQPAATQQQLDSTPDNDTTASAQPPGKLPSHILVDAIDPAPNTRAQLDHDLQSGNLDGYLWITPSTSAGARPTFVYTPGSAAQGTVKTTLANALDTVLIREQLNHRGIVSGEADAMLQPVDIASSHNPHRQDRVSAQICVSALFFIMYLVIMLYGMNVARSIIEEKTSRIFEVLLATIRPEAMMAGKIIGVGSVGLTQVGIWLATALLLTSVTGSSFHIALTPSQIVFFFVYFILGYTFYASIAAALGAMTNSEQELQQLNMLLVLPLLFCFVMLGTLLGNPDGTLARVLALIPPFTPLLMYLRVSLGHPRLWEVALSLLLTSLSICAIVWVTSRIYRIGVLMYGKRPSLPEILRWLKYS
jgi:ABC-2 type transport system permease protein